MPKAGEDAANAGSRAGFTLLMGDGSGIREREGALRALQGRCYMSAVMPLGAICVGRSSNRTVVPDTVNSIVNVLLYVLDCSRLRELAHITRLGVVCCLRPPPVGFADSPRQRGASAVCLLLTAYCFLVSAVNTGPPP